MGGEPNLSSVIISLDVGFIKYTVKKIGNFYAMVLSVTQLHNFGYFLLY